MRRVVVLALLAMALAMPMAVWADVITIVNIDGSITISGMAGTGGLGTIGTSTISTKGSELSQFGSFSAPKGSALGILNYSTGVLTSGSISGGGTFAAGGSFDVIGQGAWLRSLTGNPKQKGKLTLFAGSFSSPLTWTLDSKSGVHLTYTLSGNVVGTLWNGVEVHGTTTQNFYSTKGQLSAGIGHISMGVTTVGTPEPGTLGLLGTGLVAIAGMFRRKLMS